MPSSDDYKKMSIKEAVEEIERGHLFLPAIQRHFVWTPNKIINLFDSIMLRYPIGTFLFWTVSKDYINEKKYSIYRFIQNYNERDNYLNERVGNPITHVSEITAVLDGQQRISSMYMALKGSIAFRKPKTKNTYPEKLLYLNLVTKNIKEDDDEETNTFDFQLLTNDELNEINLKEKDLPLNQKKHVWFLVKEVLNWEDTHDVTDYYCKKGYSENSIIIGNLMTLWHRICEEKIINYYNVNNNNLNNVLDIFIRVNSGGVILSKTDLLFSTIVAQWDDARSEFEDLLKEINHIGEHFNFNNDFLMRACLVLTDSPVLFKVETFKEDNIKRIKNSWGKIKESLINVVTIISEFGFNGDNLLSQNAIIPIAYHIFKGGNIDEPNKKEIKNYLISSLLRKVFSTKGDAVLRTIRVNMRKENKSIEEVYELKNQNFEFSEFIKMKLPGDHRLNLNDEDIEEILQEKKGTAYTFMVLSLLYPHYKWNNTVIHQDHIHPFASFSTEKLKAIGLQKPEIAKWQEYANQLPNLELLLSKENESKNDTPFDNWLSLQKNRYEYLKRNYIPNVSFDFSNFIEFFEKRKEIMKREIKNIFS